jgi:hypothetical protein
MDKKPTLEDLLKKVEEQKKLGAIDLSTEEDLSVAIMNLISLEEHFFFTGSRTSKTEYFDLLSEVRETRKDLLARLIDKHEGETWCVSKHLLATTMRLIEVGTKLHADGKKEEARDIFERAYKMYSMFWALRLKLIDTSGFKEAVKGEKSASDKAMADRPWTMDDIVNKLVNCCDE